MKKKKEVYTKEDRIKFINQYRNIFEFICEVMQGCVAESLLGELIFKFDICNNQTLNGDRISMNKFLEMGRKIGVFDNHKLKNGHLYTKILNLSNETINYMSTVLFNLQENLNRDDNTAIVKSLYLLNLYNRNQVFFTSKEYFDIVDKTSYIKEMVEKCSLFNPKFNTHKLYKSNIFIESEKEYYNGVYVNVIIFRDLLYKCDNYFVENIINQMRLSFNYIFDKYKQYNKENIHINFEIFILGNNASSSYSIFFDKERSGYIDDIKHFLDDFEDLVYDMQVKNCQYKFVESIRTSSRILLRYVDIDYSELSNRQSDIICALKTDCSNRVIGKKIMYEQMLKEKISDFISITLDAVDDISEIKVKYQQKIDNIKSTRIPNVYICDKYEGVDNEEYFHSNESFCDMVHSSKTETSFFFDSEEKIPALDLKLEDINETNLKNDLREQGHKKENEERKIGENKKIVNDLSDLIFLDDIPEDIEQIGIDFIPLIQEDEEYPDIDDEEDVDFG